MEGKCSICGVPRYGVPAVSLHGGRWRHTNSEACLTAVGIELRALRTLIEAIGPQGEEKEEVLGG